MKYSRLSDIRRCHPIFQQLKNPHHTSLCQLKSLCLERIFLRTCFSAIPASVPMLMFLVYGRLSGRYLFGHLHYTTLSVLWLVLFLLYTSIYEEPCFSIQDEKLQGAVFVLVYSLLLFGYFRCAIVLQYPSSKAIGAQVRC